MLCLICAKNDKKIKVIHTIGFGLTLCIRLIRALL